MNPKSASSAVDADVSGGTKLHVAASVTANVAKPQTKNANVKNFILEENVFFCSYH